MVKTKEKEKAKDKPGYKTIPIGGMIPKAGSSKEYKTGDWRVKSPHIDRDKCINCLFCYIYCPERCVRVEDGKVVKVDLDYCKGCGICASECPKDAIEMKLE